MTRTDTLAVTPNVRQWFNFVPLPEEVEILVLSDLQDLVEASKLPMAEAFFSILSVYPTASYYGYMPHVAGTHVAYLLASIFPHQMAYDRALEIFNEPESIQSVVDYIAYANACRAYGRELGEQFFGDESYWEVLCLLGLSKGSDVDLRATLLTGGDPSFGVTGHALLKLLGWLEGRTLTPLAFACAPFFELAGSWEQLLECLLPMIGQDACIMLDIGRNAQQQGVAWVADQPNAIQFALNLFRYLYVGGFDYRRSIVQKQFGSDHGCLSLITVKDGGRREFKEPYLSLFEHSYSKFYPGTVFCEPGDGERGVLEGSALFDPVERFSPPDEPGDGAESIPAARRLRRW